MMGEPMAGESKAWMCTVCGYIHTGNEPPESCVLCGAGRDLFEPYEESAPAMPEGASQWRCLLCDYVADGDEPPEVCPICGATADQFEAYHEALVETVRSGDTPQTFVVVGAGIAGISAAESIRKVSPEAKIVVLSKEAEQPYYRLNLTRYLAGEIGAEQLPLHPEAWYQQQRIELRLSTEVCTVDADQRRLALRSGETLSYDKLILAMGSHPFVPPVPGANRENVTVLRSRKDTDAILAQVQPDTRVVVIGGGLLGLEAAGALVGKVLSVSVLEGYGWLLPRQLSQTAAVPMEQHVRSLGIELHQKVQVKEIVGDERARGVLLEDGTLVPADLVIISTGVRPNSYVARLAGLEVHSGIVVNNHLQTGVPDIYAAGDVAEHLGVVYGIWGPSQFQGTMAGLNAAGSTAEFVGIPRSNVLKVLGFDMFSIGRIVPEDASYDVIEGAVNGHYQSFIFRDSHMVGAILLGDTSQSAHVKHTVEQQQDCSRILQGDRDVTSVLAFLVDQPD
jgi:nitrite reductase (NADH) large subunit